MDVSVIEELEQMIARGRWEASRAIDYGKFLEILRFIDECENFKRDLLFR